MKKNAYYWSILWMCICCFSLPLMAEELQQRTQVTTPDKSLEAKVIKAYREGDYVVVDMLLCNVSKTDYTLSFSLVNADRISVYDEFGNQYSKGIVGRFGNDNNTANMTPKALLPSEVPIRFSLFIPGVEEKVSLLPRINFGYCRPTPPHEFKSWKMSVKNVMITN